MYRISRRRGSAAAVVVVVVAILAIAGGAMWYFMLRSTPERAVATMLQAQADGDEEKLRSVLTERSQQWMSMSGGVVGMAQRSGEEPQYEIGAAEVDGEQANVPVTFPAPEQMQRLTDRKELTIRYALRNEDGEWKVDLQDTLKSVMGDLIGGADAMTPPEGAEQ